MPVQVTSEATIITGESIPVATMLTLQACLKLEAKGMKRRGQSVFSIVKKQYGLKGNIQQVQEQFNTLVEKEKAKAAE